MRRFDEMQPQRHPNPVLFSQSHQQSVQLQPMQPYSMPPQPVAHQPLQLMPQYAMSQQPIAHQQHDFLLPIDELTRRAHQGDPSAQYILGTSLNNGNKGCIIDVKSGWEWIIMASKQSATSPAGSCALGECYEAAAGGFLFKDREKARQCYMAAALQGYIPGQYELVRLTWADAFNIETRTGHVGYYSSSTKIVHKDQEMLAEMASQIMPAVRAGYTPAIKHLSEMYYYGNGVPLDKQEAFKLVQMCAVSGHAWGKRDLANMYEHGVGVPPDRAEAKRWYLAARDQGFDVSKELAGFRSSCCTIL